ncbi:MAG: thiamine phosphate synthase [Campylobacterota bacterium]
MKKYLITDPKYYGNKPEIFKLNLIDAIKRDKPTFVCFRDKTSSNFQKLAEVFVDTCKELKVENILINSDYKLAKKLDATGVHLTSKQFKKIKKAKDLDLFVIISCHDFTDIEKALKEYANAITYSPIFKTPNKGQPKGINQLKEAVEIFDDINIFALGGIVNDEHIKKVSKAKPFGFASIRYFT